jgi:hypothetical protein
VQMATITSISTEGDDFESRFSFSNDIPPPEKWEPGPKTYPSKARSAKSKFCLCSQYFIKHHW